VAEALGGKEPAAREPAAAVLPASEPTEPASEPGEPPPPDAAG